MSEVHIKLKAVGTRTALSRFHAICAFKDGEWPYVCRMETPGPERCLACGGIIFKRPLLDTEDIYTAAKQVGLAKLKIKRFVTKEECAREFTKNNN